MTQDKDSDHSDSSDKLVGVLLGGKYLVKELIAFGGFGSVYRALHTDMDKDVAIKLLHRRYSADHEAVKRFQQEARIISSLRHENILSVYSMGSHEDRIYMVMELVHGKSISEVLYEGGPLPWQVAMPLLLQICKAMGYAHQHDVVHRDLKPANVLVCDQDKQADGSPRIRVVDFGLGKLITDGQKLTRTGVVVGDPNYMSPEQAQGKKLDARTDIYSFGCLMYELFVGMPPFEADSSVALMFKQVSEQPRPFPDKSAVPRGLQQIVFAALEKNPDDRFQTFEEISDALAKIVANPDAVLPQRTKSKVKVGKRKLGWPVRLLVATGAVAAIAVLLVSLKRLEAQRQDLDDRKTILREQIDAEWAKADMYGLDLIAESQQLLKQAEATNDPDLIARARLLTACYGYESDFEETLAQLPSASQLAPDLVEQRKYLQARSYYAQGDWKKAQPLLQDLYDKFFTSSSSVPGDYKFKVFLRSLHGRNITLNELADTDFHLGKFDQAEWIMRQQQADNRLVSSAVEDLDLALAIKIARHGFAAVERDLKNGQQSNRSRLQLVKLYGVWGDSRVPKLTIDLINEGKLQPTEQFYAMEEAIAVAIARQDRATLEQCYRKKLTRADYSAPDHLISLARILYETGKTGEAERLLDQAQRQVKTRTLTESDPSRINWVVTRTRFFWRLKEKKTDEAEKLLKQLDSMPRALVFSPEPSWFLIYRLLLTQAETTNADLQSIENAVLKNPSEQDRIGFLWQQLKVSAQNGLTDPFAVGERLQAAYKAKYHRVPARVVRQIEVSEIYRLFVMGKYAEVEKRARPFAAKLMATHGTGFTVSQLLEPYCISLDKIGQHSEADSNRKAMAEFVFFDQLHEQPELTEEENVTRPWKYLVGLDRFSNNELPRF